MLGYLKEKGCHDFDFLDLRLGVPDAHSPTWAYTGTFGESFVHDIPDLPRTNNDRESEFRRLNQHLLRTTGQKGGTRRLIQRSGAWELIPRPDSLTETVKAISTVEDSEYEKERTRVRSHRDRFRFHTRSVKRSRKQLQDLKKRWLQLPPDKSPDTAHFQGERTPS